jgi:hypothetical protein
MIPAMADWMAAYQSRIDALEAESMAERVAEGRFALYLAREFMEGAAEDERG